MKKRFEESAELTEIRDRLMKFIRGTVDPELSIKAAAEWRQTERLRLDIHKQNMAIKTAETPPGETSEGETKPSPLHGLKVVG